MAKQKDKVDTNSVEFQSARSNVDDEHVHKYDKLDKGNAANTYSRVSTRIVDMIIGKGNLNSFKEYLKHTGYINNVEDENTLNIFRKSIDTRLSQSNLIILTCKYSRDDILEHLFDKSVPVLKSNYFNNQIKPGDKDESNHSAFYYAIRSGKRKLVKLLLNSWPCKDDLKDLPENLAEAYEELKLKNVNLSDEVVVFVEERLIDARFYCKNSNELENSIDDIKERIELIVDNIKLLKNEFLNAIELDDKFFLRGKFIVQNLNILKKFLRSTYNKLPWEEIEFCLITFIQSQQRGDRTKLSVFNFYSTPKKLFNYLEIFSNQLLGEVKFITPIPISVLSNFPPTNRDETIQDIINVTPDYKELYEDYSRFRDTYSLEMINEHLNYSLHADIGKQEKVLIFSRTIQIIGEQLRNTWEYPNMSKLMSQLIITSVSKDLRKILMNLRDSSCPNYCYIQKQDFERICIDECTGKKFEEDFSTLNPIVSNLLHVTQNYHIVNVLKTMASSKTVNDMKKAIERFDMDLNSYWFDQQDEYRSIKDFKHLKELFYELSKTLSNKSDVENSLFCKLKEVAEMQHISPLNQFDYNIQLRMLKNMRSNIDIENINEINLPQIVYFAEKCIEDVSSSEGFINLQKLITKLLSEFILVHEFKMYKSGDYERFIPVVNRIFTQIGLGIHDIKWIEDLHQILYTNKSFQMSYKNNISKIALEEEISPKDLDKFYSDKQLVLKRIIDSSYEFDRNLVAFRNNQKLQVVIKTLLFDVMFILNSQGRLADNNLLCDSPAPLLLGKNLFNYLAYSEAFYNIKLYDSQIAVFLNAKKLTTNIDKNKKIGTVVSNNFAKLKCKFNEDLTNIINQEMMFKVIEQNDLEKLKKISFEGAEYHGRNHRNSTALHFAVKSSCKIVEFILDQKINAGLRDITGSSPLHLAVKYHKTDIVKFLIEKKMINVNVVTNYKDTPLHVAALHGYKEIIIVLLRNNGDTLFRNSGTYTPLHYAAINGNKDVVSIFLKKEKCVDDNKLFTRETVLHLAAELGHTELVKYLVDLKCNVNHRNKYKKVPIFFACLNDHLEVVKILVSNNANINIPSTDGFTPLANAAQNGNVEMVKILLERRAKLKMIDLHSDALAMDLAAKFGHVDVIKLLLDNKLAYDCQNGQGMTPLFSAVFSGHLEVVKLLTRHNARLNVRTKEDYTPLDLACINGHEKIVDFLLKQGVSYTGKPSPLHISASNGKIEVIKVLVAHGDDLNRKERNRTPLHFAAEHGHEDLVKFLLDKGVSLTIKDSQGFTPLILAALNGHEKVVEILMKADDQVNVTSDIRYQAVHVSTMKGCSKMVDLLLNVNSKVNIQDHTVGKISLQLAIENNNLKIAKSLLDHQTPVNGLDVGNYTPLSRASRFNYGDMFELLIQYGANVAAEKSELMNEAINRGSDRIIKVLLERNIIKIDTKLTTGCPLLHQASMLGHSSLVELLLVKKAEVNALHYGGSALALAAMHNHTGVIKVLLRFHGDPDLYSKFPKSNENSPSAIQVAVTQGHLEALKLMLKYSKRDINENDSQGLTFLHVAAINAKQKEDFSRYLDVVKCLVEKGANVKAATVQGDRVIHFAAQNGCQSIVEYLLSMNEDINCIDRSGWTSLHFAVKNKHKDLVEYLLLQKIDVNLKNFEGSSALHMAVQSGCADIVEILLKNGAAYNSKDNKKIEAKRLSSNLKIVGLFKSIENLFESVTLNNGVKCQEYLKQGAIINAVNDELCTPLHYACWKGFADIVTVLLDNQANPNVFNSNDSTPLHYAAKFTNLNIVKKLLLNGAIYNSKTKKGNKPMDLASSKEIIELLSLIEKLFNKVENNDSSVLNDMVKIKDQKLLKIIFAVNNEKKESLITVAMKNDFSKVAKLKHGLIPDSTTLAKKALDLIRDDKFSEALVVYKKLHEKHEEILGPDNPATLEVLLEVGDTLHQIDQFSEALPIFEKIYEKQKEIFGADHKITLNSRSVIGNTLHHLRRFDEALEICKDTYEKQKKILDKYDNGLLSTLGHLAMVLCNLDRYQESLLIQLELHDRYSKLLGDSHPNLFSAKRSIGKTLASLERYDEALELLQKVYKMKKKLLGANHPDTLKMIFYQIEVFADQERFDQALNSCRQLLSTQEKVLGADHPETWCTKIKLGDIFVHLDKVHEALNIYTETIKKMKKILGPEHPEVEVLSDKIQTVVMLMQSMKFFGVLESEAGEITVADAARGVAEVQQFIESGFDINIKDDNGFCLLHHATNYGALSVVKYLLKNGADYNSLTKKGNTALHMAVLKNNNKIVDFILQHVKETNPKGLQSYVDAKTTSSGMTCMHVAAKNGSEEIVRSLLKYGAMYDSRNLVDGKKPREITQNDNILKLLTMLDELFNDLENNRSALHAKIKKLPSCDLAIIKNVRNRHNAKLC